MGIPPPPRASRLRRLAEELSESGFDPGGDEAWRELVLIELHNTRNRALVYHFTKVPEEAARK